MSKYTRHTFPAKLPPYRAKLPAPPVPSAVTDMVAALVCIKAGSAGA